VLKERRNPMNVQIDEFFSPSRGLLHKISVVIPKKGTFLVTARVIGREKKIIKIETSNQIVISDRQVSHQVCQELEPYGYTRSQGGILL